MLTSFFTSPSQFPVEKNHRQKKFKKINTHSHSEPIIPKNMDLPHCTKILAFSLPVFFFLLSRANSSSATIPPSPTPSPSSSASTSVFAAAETLRAHGYSLYASALISTFSNTANLSGTILAAPDFIFAFSPSLTSRVLPRPSTTLLRYHSLKPPSLRWLDLTTRPDGDELATLLSDYCLFLFKNPNGEVAIASSKKPILAVNIRQPDLYVDENLSIHGVDGVLDPSTADKCSTLRMSDPAVQIQSWVHRSFLDRAMRVLRRRGFHVAATALALRRPDLLTLPAVTVFAPSDKVLFSNPHGFRYNARHHIVPERLRFDRLTSFTEGTEFETLAPNKTIFIESANDVVTVNGVRIDGVELYQNRWVVLYSIEPMTLDDAAGESPDTRRWDESSPETEGQIRGNISKFSSTGNFGSGVPSAAPETTKMPIGPPLPSPERLLDQREIELPGLSPATSTKMPMGPPSPSPERFLDQRENGLPGLSPATDQEYMEDVMSKLIRPTSQSPSQSPSPVIGGATNAQCDVGLDVTVGVDSSDSFCPVIPENAEIQNAPDVARFDPLDGVAQSQTSKRLLQSEPLTSDAKGKRNPPDSTNIAADLFYYI